MGFLGMGLSIYILDLDFDVVSDSSQVYTVMSIGVDLNPGLFSLGFES